jgi:hypothetical protein
MQVRVMAFVFMGMYVISVAACKLRFVLSQVVLAVLIHSILEHKLNMAKIYTLH